MTTQFAKIRSSLLFMLLYFSCQFWLLVQVSCQYDYHELWQFFYERSTRNAVLEMPPSVFSQISRDCRELKISQMSRMIRIFLIKCYWLLEYDRITVFTSSELLKEIQIKTNTKKWKWVWSKMLTMKIFHNIFKFLSIFEISTCISNKRYKYLN